jgi:hypothetical protein
MWLAEAAAGARAEEGGLSTAGRSHTTQPCRMNDALFTALETAVRATPSLDPSASCQLVFTILNPPASRIINVSSGSVTLASATDKLPPHSDACQLEFADAKTYLDAMSGNKRKMFAVMARGALKLAGDSKLLRDPRLRPLLSRMRNAGRRIQAVTGPASALAFTIHGAEQRPDGSTAYAIELRLLPVNNGGGGAESTGTTHRSLSASKRFSEFEAFRAAIEGLLPGAELLALPEKRIFHSEQVIRERVKRLEHFLGSVLQCEGITSTSLIPGFLGVSQSQWTELLQAATAVAADGDDDDADGDQDGGGFAFGSGGAWGGAAPAAEEEMEELRERVEELEGLLVAQKRLWHAQQMTAARAEASRLGRLGWTAFGGLAAALTLYSAYHGVSRGRFALTSLAIVSSTAVFLQRSKGMVRRMVYGFWVAGVVFVQYHLRVISIQTEILT